MQSGSEFGHLLFDILVLGALLFQLLFHFVECLHHVLFLLSLCITFTLLFLKLLLQLMVLCDGELQQFRVKGKNKKKMYLSTTLKKHI